MANSYLKYDTFEQALERANTEGESLNLPYFTNSGITRYVTYPVQLSNGKWCLEVSGYSSLSESEISNSVSSVTVMPDIS